MERNKKGLNILAFGLGILLVGGLIQAAGWLKGDKLVFPGVGEILQAFVRMLGEERTWKQIGTTLIHLAEALAAAEEANKAIVDWKNSILSIVENTSDGKVITIDGKNGSQKDNTAVISFNFIPIWNLFPAQRWDWPRERVLLSGLC